jgi:hypothetical protein
VTTDRLWQTYRLEDLWRAMDDGLCVFHALARDGRGALGLTEAEGNRCLRSLSREHFVKSSADRTGRKGLFHDVYKTTWNGQSVYIKFFRLRIDQPFVVSSFKRDTDSEA